MTNIKVEGLVTFDRGDAVLRLTPQTVAYSTAASSSRDVAPMQEARAATPVSSRTPLWSPSTSRTDDMILEAINSPQMPAEPDRPPSWCVLRGKDVYIRIWGGYDMDALLPNRLQEIF